MTRFFQAERAKSPQAQSLLAALTQAAEPRLAHFHVDWRGQRRVGRFRILAGDVRGQKVTLLIVHGRAGDDDDDKRRRSGGNALAFVDRVEGEGESAGDRGGGEEENVPFSASKGEGKGIFSAFECQGPFRECLVFAARIYGE